MILNTAGGIAGGDDFSIAIEAGAGARLAVISAAAEKVYRAIDAASRMTVRLSVAADAALRWLPQETILFDGARLQRSIEVDVAAGGSLVMAESMVFGRIGDGRDRAAGRRHRPLAHPAGRAAGLCRHAAPRRRCRGAAGASGSRRRSDCACHHRHGAGRRGAGRSGPGTASRLAPARPGCRPGTVSR